MNRFEWMAGLASVLLALAGLGCSVAPSTGEPASAPRRDGWRILGPGGGGAQFYPAVSPHDSRLVLNSTDMRSCFLSRDGGQSWRLFSLRFVCRFGFDAGRREVLYAAAGPGGLYRSEDEGESWRLILPQAAQVAALGEEEDEGSPILWGPRGQRWDWVRAVAADPERSGVVFAGWGTEVHESRDGGATWTLAGRCRDAVRALWVDPSSPPEQRRVWAAHATGLAVRDGAVWRELPAPAAELDYSIGFDAGQRTTLLAAVAPRQEGGMWVSRDEGAHWESMAAAFQALPEGAGVAPLFRAVAAAPDDARRLCASYSGLGAGRKEASGWFGMACSEDAGRNWRLVWKETWRRPSPRIRDFWMTPRFGPGWGENPLTIAFAPRQPQLMYVTDMGRTLRTQDGGQNWDGVYARRLADGTATTTGLDVLSVYGVHFDPFASGRLLGSYTDIGLMRSENGGLSWIDSGSGIPAAWRNTAYWVEFDPQEKGRVWVALSSVHDLPREKMLRGRSASALGRGGVACSTNSGRRWKPCAQGLPDAPVTHLVLDKRSPAGRRVLYAAVFGHGVWRSADGGSHWESWNEGLDRTAPRAWRLWLDSLGSLYVVITQEKPAHTEPAQAGAVFRRSDGAARWAPLPLPGELHGPTDLASEAAHPLRLYLTAWGWERAGRWQHAERGGLWMSEDGGASWRQTFAGDQHLYSVTVDTRHPGRLYMAGYESAIWRSDDAGRNWRRLPGFNFKAAHRVITDPRQDGRIFVTTYGGGIWMGDAAGSPGAREDIAGPAAVTYTRTPDRAP